MTANSKSDHSNRGAEHCAICALAVMREERDRYRKALVDIHEIAAREWQADETNYEWYGDIAGTVEELLGIDIWSKAAADEEAR